VVSYFLSVRSNERLLGVHPELVRVVKLAIAYSPHDFMVSEGVRGLTRQRELVANGSSMTLHSKHLLQLDGFGHAVDLVAVGDLDHDGEIDAQDKALTWDTKIYSGIAGAMKQAAKELSVGIRWGGDFRKFFDGPHFELVA
jgi:peptidoglycan L-alanyl-D-glutamate endopeptidase CwlK